MGGLPRRPTFTLLVLYVYAGIYLPTHHLKGMDSLVQHTINMKGRMWYHNR